MTKKLVILTTLLGIFVTFLNLTCCRDCPDCPTYPGEPEPGSYYVFISDGNQDSPGYIWIVDSKTDSLIDSILTPDPRITVMDASCDGQYVATFAQGLGRVLIYDVDIRDTVTSLSPSGFPSFTPDSLHLLTASGNQVCKFRISDWSLVASGTMPFSPSDLFSNSPYLVGVSDDGKEYCIFDYEQMATVKSDSIVRADGSTPQALRLIVSSDDNYFYFIARPDKIFKMEIETSSIIDSAFIIYGAYHGRLECSPDGEYIIVTEVTQWPDATRSGLFLIEQSSFTAYRRISTYGLNPFFPSSPVPIGQFAVTPDGSKVFAAGESIGIVPPLSFNLIEMTAANIKGLTTSCYAVDVAVGKLIQK